MDGTHGHVDLKPESLSAGAPRVEVPPTLRQVHVLGADPASAGAPKFTTPDINQDHNLAAVPVVAGLARLLASATDAKIRETVRGVYSAFPDRTGPNINEIVDPVKQILAAFGLNAPKDHIQKIADEPEFKLKRRPSGPRRT
jgi:hypothetical protein